MRSRGLKTLVRLVLICAFGSPGLTLAQSDESPPWSIQRVATSVLRKTQTPSTSTLAAESGWTAAAPYPTGIYHYGFAQNGEDFFIISGVVAYDLPPVTTVRRYNAITNTWTLCADLPSGLYSPPAVYYDGKIYVLDDSSGWDQDTILRIYDIETNTWGVGAPRPGQGGSGTQAAGVFNGNLYIASGGALSIYNVASNTWSVGPVPPTDHGAPVNGSYAQIGQYLYVIGGIRYAGLAGFFNSDLSKRLDMATNIWSVGPAWSFGRNDFALVAAGNRLFAMGGDPDGGSDTGSSTEVDELDTTTWPDGIWVRTPLDLPSPRFGNRAGFSSNTWAGGEVWSTGGARYTGNGYVYLTDHLLLPTNIANGGSSIVAAGPNGVLDPGETVTISLGIRNIGETGFCTTGDLTGTVQTSGGVMNPSAPQSYGAICSGGSAFRNFTFTVDPALLCSGDVAISLVVTDGAINYGTINYVFTTGNLAPVYAQNFDGVVAPALPKGWETSTVGSPYIWTISSTDPDSPPNDVFIIDGPNQHDVSDSRLDSPPILISSAYTKISFRHRYNFFGGDPYYFDGGALEVSSPNIHRGAFTEITDAAVGGSFVTGGYDGFFVYPNPLAGRPAWGGNSGGYLTTVANLGPNVAGQMIRLRFRMTATGYGDTSLGWRVDSLSVGTPVCGGNTPAVVSAVSRKTHGSAGVFDIDLPLMPLDGNIGIENRSSAMIGEHQFVVTFANPVTAGRAAVTTGAGSIASSIVNGAVVMINLTGVTDGQRLGITLPNVSDGVNLGSIMIPMGVLACDATANGAVNSSDLVLVKSQSGQPVTASNFREDVDGDGIIDAKDIAAVKLKSGRGLP